MLRTPNFASLIIYLFKRFLENFMLLPFIILEIFAISETAILTIPINFHTKLDKIELLITFDKEMISA